MSYLKSFILAGSILLASINCAKQDNRASRNNVDAMKPSGTVAINGLELPYSMEGEGTPCIVIAFKSAYQRGFSPELRKHFKFIFVDFPWSMADNGLVNPDAFELDTILDYIDGVRAAFGFNQIAILGHSIHGLMVLEYARKYPQKTTHVLAICPPYPNKEASDLIAEFWDSNASEERKALFARAQERLSDELKSDLTPSEVWIRGYVARGPKFWFNPEYDCSWILEGTRINRSLLDRFGLIFEEYDLNKFSGTIEAPVFLAIGQHDYVCPPVIWQDEKEKLPNLQYVLFEKSGHWPMLEEQERFNSELLAWMKNQ